MRDLTKMCAHAYAFFYYTTSRIWSVCRRPWICLIFFRIRFPTKLPIIFLNKEPRQERNVQVASEGTGKRKRLSGRVRRRRRSRRRKGGRRQSDRTCVEHIFASQHQHTHTHSLSLTHTHTHTHTHAHTHTHTQRERGRERKRERERERTREGEREGAIYITYIHSYIHK